MVKGLLDSLREPGLRTAALPPSTRFGTISAALAYGFFRNSEERWRLAALLFLFSGCVAFGYAVYGSANLQGRNFARQADLPELAHKWIEEAEKARSAKTISPGTPLPSTLVDARNAFERAWRSAALSDRKILHPQETWKALSYVNRLYRVAENDSSTQPNANFWADEARVFWRDPAPHVPNLGALGQGGHLSRSGSTRTQ